MVKLGRCVSCGSCSPEIWSVRENCIKCGGPIDHIEEDLGPVEHLPRVLNIGGLILIVIAIVVLIADPVGSDGGTDESGPLILILAAAFLFLFSLVSQNILGRSAVKRRVTARISRRKVLVDRPSASGDKEHTAARRTGRKILK